MPKPNTTINIQKMITEHVEHPPIYLDEAENAFDMLEIKISDLIEQHKKEFAAGMRENAAKSAIEIEPALCINDGIPCLNIFIDNDGMSAHAYIPIHSLAYPFDTFENFDPKHNAGRHGRDAEMVAVGVTDRAALAAALRTLADNVAADPVPPQEAPTRAE
jgi:hypothetical protein